MNDNNSISVTTNINTIQTNEELILPKKRKRVKELKPVTTNLEIETVQQLEKLCKENGYSRTELVKYLIEYGLKNLIIKSD